MTLYYSHISDVVEDETHSIPLSPGLTPVAYLQNLKKIYLGKRLIKVNPLKFDQENRILRVWRHMRSIRT